MIKFVSDLRQVDGFLQVLYKTDHHDIIEILLKVALNTIKQTHKLIHCINMVSRNHQQVLKDDVRPKKVHLSTNNLHIFILKDVLI